MGEFISHKCFQYFFSNFVVLEVSKNVLFEIEEMYGNLGGKTQPGDRLGYKSIWINPNSKPILKY